MAHVGRRRFCRLGRKPRRFDWAFFRPPRFPRSTSRQLVSAKFALHALLVRILDFWRGSPSIGPPFSGGAQSAGLGRSHRRGRRSGGWIQGLSGCPRCANGPIDADFACLFNEVGGHHAHSDDVLDEYRQGRDDGGPRDDVRDESGKGRQCSRRRQRHCASRVRFLRPWVEHHERRRDDGCSFGRFDVFRSRVGDHEGCDDGGSYDLVRDEPGDCRQCSRRCDVSSRGRVGNRPRDWGFGAWCSIHGRTLRWRRLFGQGRERSPRGSRCFHRAFLLDCGACLRRGAHSFVDGEHVLTQRLGPSGDDAARSLRREQVRLHVARHIGIDRWARKGSQGQASGRPPLD